MPVHVPTTADLDAARVALETLNPVLAGVTPAAVLASTILTHPFRIDRDAAANWCFMTAAASCLIENFVAHETGNTVGCVQMTCSTLATVAAFGMFVSRFTGYRPTPATLTWLLKAAPPLFKIFAFLVAPAFVVLAVKFDGWASMMAAALVTGVFLWRTKDAGWLSMATVAIGGGWYTAANHTYFDNIAWSQAAMRIGLLAMILAELPAAVPPLNRVLVESRRKVVSFFVGLVPAKQRKLAF